MRKHWWKLVTAVVLALMGLNFLFFAYQPTAHAAVKPTTPKLTVQEVQRIVKEATPYVHVDKNGVVTVDSAINSHLSADEVVIVKKYVAQYNSLSHNQKLPRYGGIAGASKTGVTPSILGCNQYAYQTHEWWGVRIYLNHCAIFIAYTFGIGAILGTLVPTAGIASVVIGLYMAALYIADTNCGNRGAYIDSIFGVIAVNAVC